MKCSLIAMARPEMITFGGANSVMRLAMAKPSASPAAASARAQRLSPSAARCRSSAIARPGEASHPDPRSRSRRLGLAEHGRLRGRRRRAARRRSPGAGP